MTSQQLAIVSTAVMSPTEDYDFREEWREGVYQARNPWGTMALFSCKSSPKKPSWPFSGWAVSGSPLPDSHPSLPQWINGLVCGLCPSLSVCGSPLLASGLAWVLFMRSMLNRAFQGGSSEGSPGAWGTAEADVHSLWADRELVCSLFSSGRGAALLSAAVKA